MCPLLYIETVVAAVGAPRIIQSAMVIMNNDNNIQTNTNQWLRILGHPRNTSIQVWEVQDVNLVFCILCIHEKVHFVRLILQISTSCAWAQRQLMSVVLHRFGSQKFGKP